MTADDTSREALIEQIENLLMDERDKYPRVHNDAPSADLAEAIVDAVVMPLIEERHRLRHQAGVSEHDRHLAWRAMDSARAEKGAAIKRAEAAEAAHKALTEAVQAALDGDSLVVCDVGVAAVPDDTLRAILTEHGAAQ